MALLRGGLGVREGLPRGQELVPDNRQPSSRSRRSSVPWKRGTTSRRTSRVNRNLRRENNGQLWRRDEGQARSIQNTLAMLQNSICGAPQSRVTTW